MACARSKLSKSELLTPAFSRATRAVSFHPALFCESHGVPGRTRASSMSFWMMRIAFCGVNERFDSLGGFFGKGLSLHGYTILQLKVSSIGPSFPHRGTRGCSM